MERIDLVTVSVTDPSASDFCSTDMTVDLMLMLEIHVGRDILKRLVDVRLPARVYFPHFPSSGKVGHLPRTDMRKVDERWHGNFRIDRQTYPETFLNSVSMCDSKST